MARITVEDCIDKFDSRFELVLVASNRARKLHSGDEPTVEKNNDKNTVIALREIADETLSQEDLKNDLIEEYQTTNFSEDEDLTEEIEEEISENENKLIEENNLLDSNDNLEQTQENEDVSENNVDQKDKAETSIESEATSDQN